MWLLHVVLSVECFWRAGRFSYWHTHTDHSPRVSCPPPPLSGWGWRRTPGSGKCSWARGRGRGGTWGYLPAGSNLPTREPSSYAKQILNMIQLWSRFDFPDHINVNRNPLKGTAARDFGRSFPTNSAPTGPWFQAKIILCFFFFKLTKIFVTYECRFNFKFKLFEIFLLFSIV